MLNRCDRNFAGYGKTKAIYKVRSLFIEIKNIKTFFIMISIMVSIMIISNYHGLSFALLDWQANIKIFSQQHRDYIWGYCIWGILIFKNLTSSKWGVICNSSRILIKHMMSIQAKKIQNDSITKYHINNIHQINWYN